MPIGHLCVFFRPLPPDTLLLAALGEVHRLFPHMPPCLASHVHTTLVCPSVGLAITLGVRTSANTPGLFQAVMSRVPWGRKMTVQVLLQMPLFLLGLFLVPGRFSWRCLGTSVKMPSLC